MDKMDLWITKAFDCVDHNMLLSKLKRYGNHETALQWINSYLSDREHFVSRNQSLIFTKSKHWCDLWFYSRALIVSDLD